MHAYTAETDVEVLTLRASASSDAHEKAEAGAVFVGGARPNGMGRRLGDNKKVDSGRVTDNTML
jgi:hypothetical protein